MRWCRILSVALVFGFVAAQGQPAPPGEAAQTERALHTLVATTGDVQVKRKGWTAYAHAGFGAALNRGDLVRLTGPARASVVCADLSIREFPAGTVSGVPCDADRRPLLVYEGSLINPTRAAESDDIPFVIAPRRTKLLSPHPRLRWSPVEGVSSFEVRVTGPSVDWKTNVSGESIDYPASAPALSPGSTYKVTVIGGGHSSDEASEPGVGFTLLDANTARAVRTESERIWALHLPSEASQLLTARYYASHGLFAEAINEIEALAKRKPAAVLSLAAGRYYQSVGVNRLAEEQFNAAARIAHGASEVETEALALEALAALYRDAFGLPADAEKQLRAALALFQGVGDADAVKAIRDELHQ